ncbi:hypothetical protein AYI69_g7405 [Smittium culicis]|uniref:Uncharacterized protein n=1 Tax=Smittium culicis TaxID=133412 RepID=A0A1R1XS65_9FUNG|nr:hypothetical protein AYI69_g7405 [Smittium culicis]
MLINWLVYAMEDLELQNDLAKDLDVVEDDAQPNPYSDNLTLLAEVLGHFFMTKEELILDACKSTSNKNKKTKDFMSKFFKDSVTDEEVDPRSFNVFFKPVCNLHYDRIECTCVEDGIPIDMVRSGITRNDLLEKYFHFLLDGPKLKAEHDLTVISPYKLNNIHAEFSKTFSSLPKKPELNEFLKKYRSLFMRNADTTKTASDLPKLYFHSKEVFEKYNSYIGTRYNSPVPTVMETIEYISVFISSTLESLVPDYRDLTYSGKMEENANESFGKILKLSKFVKKSNFKNALKCNSYDKHGVRATFKWGGLIGSLDNNAESFSIAEHVYTENQSSDINKDLSSIFLSFEVGVKESNNVNVRYVANVLSVRCDSNEVNEFRFINIHSFEYIRNNIIVALFSTQGIDGYWIGLIKLKQESENSKNENKNDETIEIIKDSECLMDSVYIGDSGSVGKDIRIDVANNTRLLVVLSDIDKGSWRCFSIDKSI